MILSDQTLRWPVTIWTQTRSHWLPCWSLQLAIYAERVHSHFIAKSNLPALSVSPPQELIGRLMIGKHHVGGIPEQFFLSEIASQLRS